MRLWHQSLIPYLDRQRLLGQHRECCALRGAGWGRPHATVNYVFQYAPDLLFAYHVLVMDEMVRRGYKPDESWRNPYWRGATIGEDRKFTLAYISVNIYEAAAFENEIIYSEHNDVYLRECVELLKQKEAPSNWEEINRLL